MDTETNFAEKLEMFRAEIDAQAKAQADKLEKQTRKKAGGAEKVRAELAKREALGEIAAQKSRLSSRVNKELSRLDSETKRAVLAHRKELIEQFFAQTEKELCAFAESERYDKWLSDAVSRALSELGDDAQLTACPRDAERIKALTGKTPLTSSAIRIGGILAHNAAGTLSGDYTLDNALEQEKQAFSQQSLLRLD